MRLALLSLLPTLVCLACGVEAGDETLDEGEVVSVTESGLGYSGWHSAPKNCDSLPGTGGIFSDASVCAQAFIRVADGKARGRVAVWGNGAYLEFYNGDIQTILEKGNGSHPSMAGCYRDEFSLDKYKGDNGVPLDVWTCTTAATHEKGFLRTKGKFCFDVKGDGYDDKCVTATATGYYKNN